MSLTVASTCTAPALLFCCIQWSRRHFSPPREKLPPKTAEGGPKAPSGEQAFTALPFGAGALDGEESAGGAGAHGGAAIKCSGLSSRPGLRRPGALCRPWPTVTGLHTPECLLKAIQLTDSITLVAELTDSISQVAKVTNPKPEGQL